MADWLTILDDQIRQEREMAKDVPRILATPDISAEQVKALFKALEKQADFAEKLRQALEKLGHDYKIVDKAARLEERYAELAATAAEALKATMAARR